MSVFIALRDTRTDAMLNAMPNIHLPDLPSAGGIDATDVVETRLWTEEHNWLYALLRSGDNVSPTFRIPDLLSACVAIVFTRDDAVERIFGFLGTDLVMRSPTTPRRARPCCSCSRVGPVSPPAARRGISGRAASCTFPRALCTASTRSATATSSWCGERDDRAFIDARTRRRRFPR